MKCEICSKVMEPIKKKDNHDLFKCKSCGFMQFDYGDADYFIKNTNIKLWTKPSKANISRSIWLEKYITDKNILDIGSGAARYQQGMNVAGVKYASYTNIDTPKVSEASKPHGLNIIPLDITDDKFVEKLPNIKYDFIMCSHVIEHVPYPSKVLDIWKKLVTKDVYIYLESPTYDNINMDNDDWLVYEHLSYFSQNSFLKLMNKKFKKVESGMHGENIYYIGTTKAKK